MDGTVLDTEKLLVRYWCQATNEAGFPMTREQALQLRSLASRYAVPLLKEWFGEACDYWTVRARRMELMQAHIGQHGLETKPGIRRLLDYLGENGYKRAVATATDFERASRYLKAVGLYGSFDKIISAHSVKNGKPQPDVYLYAAQQLGFLPEECVAAEDSPNGVRSASAAGCRTVMIPDLTRPDEELRPLLFAECGTLLDMIKLLEENN